METVEQALSQMLTSGSLLQEQIAGEPLIFLPYLRKAEDGIASNMKRLATAAAVYPKIDSEKAAAWFEQQTGMAAPILNPYDRPDFAILARAVPERTKSGASNPESAYRLRFPYTSPGGDPRKTPVFVL